MFQASVEGSEASGSSSLFIAGRVFLNMVMVVSGVPQASFWPAAVGQFAGGILKVMCCFVLLVPTPEEYRVPRVNPGVTASKLFPPLLPSLATPGPPLPYRP